MTTKRTISLIFLLGGLVPLSALLAKKGSNGLFFLDAIASAVVLILLFYAAFRERTTNEKSERVSSKTAAAIFCAIGVWVVFCFYKTLTH
jgi:hypothetical protein